MERVDPLLKRIASVFKGRCFLEGGPLTEFGSQSASVSSRSSSSLEDSGIRQGSGVIPMSTVQLLKTDFTLNPQLCRYRLKKVLGRGAGGVAILVEKEAVTADENLTDLNVSGEVASAAHCSDFSTNQRCLKLFELTLPKVEMDENAEEYQRISSKIDQIKREAMHLQKVRGFATLLQFDEAFDTFDEESNTLFFAIVSEYCDAHDLRTEIKTRIAQKVPLKEREALLIFVQIAMAIYYIHNNRMIHRDIKTANVFLLQNGMLKLGDFGFAKTLMDTISTGDGTICGTPHMMAPELWRRERYNRKVDVFALGVVFYELLTLQRPYDAPTVEGIMNAIISGSPQPMPATVSEELQMLVLSMIAPDPQNRPSMIEVMNHPRIKLALAGYEENAPHLGARGPIVERSVQWTRNSLRTTSMGAQKASSSTIGSFEFVVALHDPNRIQNVTRVMDSKNEWGDVDVFEATPIKKYSSSTDTWKGRYLRFVNYGGKGFALIITVDDRVNEQGWISQAASTLSLKYIEDVCSLPTLNSTPLQNTLWVVSPRARRFFIQFGDTTTCKRWADVIQTALESAAPMQ